ncbi:unnamed protein product, partial [Polarella glacialis]
KVKLFQECQPDAAQVESCLKKHSQLLCSKASSTARLRSSLATLRALPASKVVAGLLDSAVLVHVKALAEARPELASLCADVLEALQDGRYLAAHLAKFHWEAEPKLSPVARALEQSLLPSQDPDAVEFCDRLKKAALGLSALQFLSRKVGLQAEKVMEVGGLLKTLGQLLEGSGPPPLPAMARQLGLQTALQEAEVCSTARFLFEGRQGEDATEALRALGGESKAGVGALLAAGLWPWARKLAR